MYTTAHLLHAYASAYLRRSCRTAFEAVGSSWNRGPALLDKGVHFTLGLELNNQTSVHSTKGVMYSKRLNKGVLAGHVALATLAFCEHLALAAAVPLFWLRIQERENARHGLR